MPIILRIIFIYFNAAKIQQKFDIRKYFRYFSAKNLHISKKSSIFALDFGERPKGRQKDATRRIHREHASAVRR